MSSEKNTEGYSQKSKNAVKPKKEEYCPECQSTNLLRDYEQGQLVCRGCGLVIADGIIDMGPEWRAYDAEQKAKRSRTGAPLTYTRHDKGLSTMIDWHNRDVHGRSFSPDQKSQIDRIRNWHRKLNLTDYTEKNLAEELTRINKISDDLKLPRNIYEEACIVYRKAVKKGITKGRSSECIGGASVNFACREYNLNKTLDDIVAVMKPGYEKSNYEFKETRKEVGRDFRYLLKELEYYQRVKPFEGNKLISRFADSCENRGKVEEVAGKIYKAAKSQGLTSGRGPSGIAAASVYVAGRIVNSNENITQRYLAETAKITEVTIRNRYKELVKLLTFELTL